MYLSKVLLRLFLRYIDVSDSLSTRMLKRFCRSKCLHDLHWSELEIEQIVCLFFGKMKMKRDMLMFTSEMKYFYIYVLFRGLKWDEQDYWQRRKSFLELTCITKAMHNWRRERTQRMYDEYYYVKNDISFYKKNAQFLPVIRLY